jgi:putative sigma-54 modulation protein
MNLQMKFHQIESTPAIKQMIEHKTEKFKKFFDGNFDVKWTCEAGKEGHHAHVLIAANGFTINADAVTDDLYKTIDDVVAKVEKQLQKKKSIIKEKIHNKTAPHFENEDEDMEEEY